MLFSVEYIFRYIIFLAKHWNNTLSNLCFSFLNLTIVAENGYQQNIKALSADLKCKLESLNCFNKPKSHEQSKLTIEKRSTRYIT